MRRVTIYLPDEVYAEVESAKWGWGSKSEMLRELVASCLGEWRSGAQRRRLAMGYQQMGELNCQLSEEAMLQDSCTLDEYEEYITRQS
jgi:metal-responsive CopG/Arc/MetJ family transcriptional regulator